MPHVRARVLVHLQPAPAHAQRALADGPRAVARLRALRQEVQDQALSHQPPAAGARHKAKTGHIILEVAAAAPPSVETKG